MTARSNLMTRFSLAIGRFGVAAWIGAAVLFVVVGIREVTTPEFSTEVRDRLVLLRFPAFYVAGTILTGLGLLATAMAAVLSRCTAIRIALAALVIACGLMAVDYVAIYLPLAEMITPPGQARPPAFVTLHHWSMRINTAQLTACLVAAIALSITDGRPKDSATAA